MYTHTYIYIYIYTWWERPSCGTKYTRHLFLSVLFFFLLQNSTPGGTTYAGHLGHLAMFGPLSGLVGHFLDISCSHGAQTGSAHSCKLDLRWNNIRKTPVSFCIDLLFFCMIRPRWNNIRGTYSAAGSRRSRGSRGSKRKKINTERNGCPPYVVAQAGSRQQAA